MRCWVWSLTVATCGACNSTCDATCNGWELVGELDYLTTDDNAERLGRPSFTVEGCAVEERHDIAFSFVVVGNDLVRFRLAWSGVAVGRHDAQ